MSPKGSLFNSSMLRSSIAGASEKGSTQGDRQPRQNSMNRVANKVKNMFSAQRKGSSSNVFEEQKSNTQDAINQSDVLKDRKMVLQVPNNPQGSSHTNQLPPRFENSASGVESRRSKHHAGVVGIHFGLNNDELSLR